MTNTQMFIDFGRIVEAYHVRKKMRENVKSYKESLERERKDLRTFGMYEDCGDSYQSSFDQAQGEFSASKAYKINAEKRFKFLKLTFLETYGQDGQDLLRQHLPELVIEDFQVPTFK